MTLAFSYCVVDFVIICQEDLLLLAKIIHKNQWLDHLPLGLALFRFRNLVYFAFWFYTGEGASLTSWLSLWPFHVILICQGQLRCIEWIVISSQRNLHNAFLVWGQVSIVTMVAQSSVKGIWDRFHIHCLTVITWLLVVLLACSWFHWVQNWVLGIRNLFSILSHFLLSV